MTDAGGVLATSVTLLDPEFKLATFPAGSTPPAWAQAQITNPSAWASPPSAPEGPTDEAPQEPVGAAPAESEEDLLGELPVPPKRGPGSGRDAWAAYADSKGVVYAEDAHRDDIIAAVEA